eukprot:gene3703-4613_t
MTVFVPVQIPTSVAERFNINPTSPFVHPTIVCEFLSCLFKGFTNSNTFNNNQVSTTTSTNQNEVVVALSNKNGWNNVDNTQATCACANHQSATTSRSAENCFESNNCSFMQDEEHFERRPMFSSSAFHIFNQVSEQSRRSWEYFERVTVPTECFVVNETSRVFDYPVQIETRNLCLAVDNEAGAAANNNGRAKDAGNNCSFGKYYSYTSSSSSSWCCRSNNNNSSVNSSVPSEDRFDICSPIIIIPIIEKKLQGSLRGGLSEVFPTTTSSGSDETDSTPQNTLHVSSETSQKQQDFLDWFSDFQLDEDLCNADIQQKDEPKITYKTLQHFLDSLEPEECCEKEPTPCPNSHTFNRPEANPRLVVTPTWCVYGNSLNTEFFDTCLYDQNCGDIIVDHFQPLVECPELFQLSPGGRKILTTPNAGGSSVWSEVLSYEVLNRVFGANLKKTETEIEYVPGSKITDYSVSFNNTHIGVSVVRIINFFDLMGRKYKATFTPEYARNLLYKKLFGVIASSEAVVDKWEKQILYIWTTSSCVADVIVEEYWKVPAKLRSNTLVYVTHATNSDFLF